MHIGYKQFAQLYTGCNNVKYMQQFIYRVYRVYTDNVLSVNSTGYSTACLAHGLLFLISPFFWVSFLFSQIFAAAYFLCIFYFAIACVILFAVSRPFSLSLSVFFAAAGE